MKRDTCVQRAGFTRPWAGRSVWRAALSSSDEFRLEDIPELDPDPDSDDGGPDDVRTAPVPAQVELPPDVRDAPRTAYETDNRPDARFRWDGAVGTWVNPGGSPVSPADFFRGWSVMSLLGIHGCRFIEDHILAGLALGEPVLLIGAPGGAKTAMTERIAADMQMRFWAYDASKAMFEDIVGFPDPASLSRGEVRYVPTPLSLQGKQFILVDEVSRAHPALQNKWLEIIRSRRVMGLELPEMQHVFGAMNPAGLAGTVPLDEALAGRFTLHIAVPDINTMSDVDRRAVIESGDRNPGLPDGQASRIRWIVDAVRSAMPAVESEFGIELTTYVVELSRYLAGKEWRLDGRRQGMIRRGLAAYVAVRKVFMHGAIPRSALGRVLRQGLDALMPFGAMGRELPRIVLDGANQYAVSAMGGNARTLPPSDFLIAAEMVARGRVSADADQMSLLVTRILSSMDRSGRPEDQLRAAAAMLTLALSPQAMFCLPIETRQRVMVAFSDSLELESEDIGSYLNEAFKTTIEGLDPKIQEPVMRVAFNLRNRRSRHRGQSMDFEQMLQILSRFMMEGGAAC